MAASLDEGEGEVGEGKVSSFSVITLLRSRNSFLGEDDEGNTAAGGEDTINGAQ